MQLEPTTKLNISCIVNHVAITIITIANITSTTRITLDNKFLQKK